MNYKTIIPSFIGASVLVYESLSGHILSSNQVDSFSNAAITIFSFGVTVWGIYKNHKKGV